MNSTVISRTVLIVLLVIFLNPTVFAQDKPMITASSAVLIDGKTGQVLFDKNMHKPMHPASTTKIMTAIIALEHGNLDDIVTASKNSTKVIGTRLYLKEGEKLTLRQLLYGLLLRSANDAAIAIAEHIAGTEEKFVDMMNIKAQRLGCKNTHFVNSHGLSHEDHLISPYDMAIIARYAMNNDVFRKIVSTPRFKIPWKGKEFDRLLINKNQLLKTYKGADGIKTGYTSEAGQTFVASAVRDDQRLICVLFNTRGNNIWKDAVKLLDYGFKHYSYHKFIDSHETIKKIKVKYGSDNVILIAQNLFSYTLPKTLSPKIEKKVSIKDNITAPIQKGQVLGKLHFYLNNKKIGEINLVAQNSVARSFYTYPLFWVVLVLLIIIWKYFRHKKKSKIKKNKIHYISLQKMYYRHK